MTAPVQKQDDPTLGELALEDLSLQLARVSRDLAVVRQQFAQLSRFVEQNADKLGLSPEGNSEPAVSRVVTDSD